MIKSPVTSHRAFPRIRLAEEGLFDRRLDAGAMATLYHLIGRRIVSDIRIGPRRRATRFAILPRHLYACPRVSTEKYLCSPFVKVEKKFLKEDGVDGWKVYAGAAAEAAPRGGIFIPSIHSTHRHRAAVFSSPAASESGKN